MLAGCLLALGWRIAVNARPERRYSDTPTTLFLLFAVASGFMVEALGILPTIGDPVHAWAFAGNALAQNERAASNLEQLISAIKDAETAARGYVISGRDEHLELLDQSKRLIPVLLRQMQEDARIARAALAQAGDAFPPIAASVPGTW